MNYYEKEIWKDANHKNYYISNFGRIKSTKHNKEKILKTCLNKYGYSVVTLCNNNIKKQYFVHRLVAEAFLEIPEELRHLEGTRYLQVNHKDECKTNNNVHNLEWCDAKYNNNYGTTIERSVKNRINGVLSKPVLQYTLDGQFVREWESTKECSRNGFNQGNVASCCRGERKTHKGFIWIYKNA